MKEKKTHKSKRYFVARLNELLYSTHEISLANEIWSILDIGVNGLWLLFGSRFFNGHGIRQSTANRTPVLPHTFANLPNQALYQLHTPNLKSSLMSNRKKIPAILLIILSVVFIVPFTNFVQAQAKKPNIVVIMGDDIGIWNIGAAGFHKKIFNGKLLKIH
jgi:hypothetical protein